MSKKINGFSLIEVLISLILLSFILLGFDAMEMTALSDGRQTYFFNIAIHQLQNMNERLYVLGNNEGRLEQLTRWNNQNASVLPKGKGEISEDTLTLYWGKQAACVNEKIGMSGCLKLKLNPLEQH